MEQGRRSVGVQALVKQAQDAESKNLGSAHHLYHSALELADPDDLATAALCFAGIGRIELSHKSPFALAYLEKALELLHRIRADPLLVQETSLALLNARLASESDPAPLDILSPSLREQPLRYALAVAQWEMAIKHYHHCAQALDCVEALAKNNTNVRDLADTMRRTLSRASKKLVSGTAITSPEQAIALLDCIAEEHEPSLWLRSWTPWFISAMTIAVVGGITAAILRVNKD